MKMERPVVFPSFFRLTSERTSTEKNNPTKKKSRAGFTQITSLALEKSLVLLSMFSFRRHDPSSVHDLQVLMGRATSLPNVTSVHCILFPPFEWLQRIQKRHLSTFCCIVLTFLWSKAIILKIKTRLAILCGMLLSGVSGMPHQRQGGTSQPQTHYFPLILRTVSCFQTFTDKLQSLCPVLYSHLNSTLTYTSFSEKEEKKAQLITLI